MNKHLALVGGKPITAPSKAAYVWPPITKKIEEAVVKQLHESISIYNKSGIFKKFEDEWAKFHRRKHALLFSSGTQTIHSMYVAAGLAQGDEVICPAYTFFATVTPLLHTGAKPILCDCDQNGNIDPKEIAKKITAKTKAVVITHMWGIPCQMDEIVRLCRQHKLLLLEDCSHAHGATYKNKLLGSFGDMAAWSLQGPKNVTGGEGGILVTDNHDYYYRSLLLGHYNKRCKTEIPKDHPLSKFSVTGMGFKYRAHPLATIIAYQLFKDLRKHLAMRTRYAKMLFDTLSKCHGVRPPTITEDLKPSWYAFVYQFVPDELGGLSIDRYFEALQAEGLKEADLPRSTSPLNLLPLFQNPSTLFPIYKKIPWSYKPGDFPQAESFYNHAVKIPVWALQSDEKTVKAYCKGISKISQYYKELL